MSQAIDRLVSHNHETKNTAVLQKTMENLPQVQRARVAEIIARDSRLSKLLARTASVAGAAWNGWENGVNSSLRSMGEGLEETGKFLGESAAIAIHGKDGEFVDHAVHKTEWIRKGLDITGEFVGTSAAIMVENGVSKTLDSTGTYWGEAYDAAKKSGNKMSPEQIAYATGNIAGNVAVGAVTGYALKEVQMVNAINKDLSFGRKLAGLNKSISQGGQLGVEYLGGNHINVEKRLQNNAAGLVPHRAEAVKPSRETVITHAKLGDGDRLQKAETILQEKGLLQNSKELKRLGLLDAQGQLTPYAKDKILLGHASGGKAVFEQDFGSIRAKARASEGLPKSWKKELMDQGIMGVEKSTIVTSQAFEQLKKTNQLLANQLESFMDPARTLKFPTGSMGKDWANEIITSTLEPLHKAKSKLPKELYASIREQTIVNLESQLKTLIHYRLNGHREWIEQIGVRECFEKLSANGFHVNPDIFSGGGNVSRLKGELDTVLRRARISSAGEKSMERITLLRTELSQERKEISKKLASPALTESGFDNFKLQISTKRKALEQKLEELQGLQTQLSELKNTSIQESKGIQNIKSSIAGLQDEISILHRFEQGPEMVSAQKTIQVAKSEAIRTGAEKELQEKMNRGFFAMSPEQRAELILSPEASGLNRIHSERFFNNNYTSLDANTKAKFTPEVMKKFGTHESNIVFNDQFLDLSESARAQLILSGHAPQISKDNWERFFGFNFHLLDPSIQAKFTPEVLEKLQHTIESKVLSQEAWGSLVIKYVKRKSESRV